MCFLLSLWNWKTSKEGKDGKVGVGLIIHVLHMSSDNCNLPWGGLHRNSVDRITDRPDMTSAVYRGRKASSQTKKNIRDKVRGIKVCMPSSRFEVI